MSQQKIDFGSFPDDPSADAIRTAFKKVQDNFNELYKSSGQTSLVTSINRTPAPGVTVNSTTGNVIISANISCVQVRTSSLSLGIAANGGTAATLTQGSQWLVIDLPSNISNVSNIALTGTLTAAGNVTGGNLNTTGTARVGNLITSSGSGGSITGANLIQANHFYGVIETAAQPNITSVGNLTSITVSGNTTLSTLTVSGNTTVANLTAGSGSGGSITGANVVQANYFVGTVYTGTQPYITSVGTLADLTVTGGISTGTGTGGNITGANLVQANYFSASKFYIKSVTTGIIAAGTTQANATAITSEMNVVSTVPAGSGIILPTATPGIALTVTNTTSTALLVYPASTASVNSLATNAAFTHAANTTLHYMAPTSTKWYTSGAN